MSQMSENSALDVFVAINRFGTDTEAELAMISAYAGEKCGVEAVVSDAWARGAAGAEALARASLRSPTRRRALSSALSRRDAADREDAHDRPRDLWRQ